MWYKFNYNNKYLNNVKIKEVTDCKYLDLYNKTKNSCIETHLIYLIVCCGKCTKIFFKQKSVQNKSIKSNTLLNITKYKVNQSSWTNKMYTNVKSELLQIKNCKKCILHFIAICKNTVYNFKTWIWL